jgi:signal transduction histidine kinase
MESLSNALPEWTRSARFRLAVVYSASLFVIGGLLIAGLYFALSRSIGTDEFTKDLVIRINTETQQGTFTLEPGMESFGHAVNQTTMRLLKNFSFLALGILFFISLGIGWVVAGQLLAPVDRITEVARRIQATDLSQRISLERPQDELKRLADTFDSMLDRLDEAFGSQRRFITDASHELRNPLAVIRTNLDVVLSDPKADEKSYRDASIVVKRATERMSKMVDDLLALARLESPQNLDERVEVGEVATEIADEFVAVAQARGIELRRSIADGVWVIGDRFALKRALANLAQNAVRFAPANSVVTIASGMKEGWAWLAVEDQGPGIPTSEQSQVFDRFWRADKSRSRSLGGSGLGLSIVRQVAEAHCGVVKLASDEGRGSTFVMWIPAQGDGDATALGAPDLTRA